MNIFELYYDNGKSADFWVIRNSWGNTVARVVAIDKFQEGTLKGIGQFPYFDDAKEKVYAEIYNLVEENGEQIFEQVFPIFEKCPHNPTLAILSCPGTYAYSRFFPEGGCFKIRRIGATEIIKIEAKKLEYKVAVTNSPDNRMIDPDLLADANALIGMHGNIKLDFSNEVNAFYISFPYSEHLVSAIKKISSKLRNYDPMEKSWKVDIEAISDIKSLISDFSQN
jgi:hypothetical protein